MLFRYYFFKEGTRNYEVADLIKYFSQNSYFTIEDKNENEKIARYFNPVLNFSADFVIANKSIVPGIERLNPKFIDVNLRVEFQLLSPDYDANLIINICEDITKMFNFYVYNEVFEDVSPFKRLMMLKAFQVVKRAYAKKYPLEMSKYYHLERESLNKAYDYLQQVEILKDLLKEEEIKVPAITYYAVEGKRRVYTCVEISRFEPFVFPAFVDIVHVDDGKLDMFISTEEFSNKTSKYFHPIESSLTNLFYVGIKDMKKVNKILTKATFSKLILELTQVNFKKVLDV